MNIFALISLLPHLGTLLVVMKNLPQFIDEIRTALKAVSAALDAVPADVLDVSGAKAQLAHVDELLKVLETDTAEIFGSAPAAPPAPQA